MTDAESQQQPHAAREAGWQRLSPVALLFLIISHGQRVLRENLVLFAGAGAGAAFTDWLGVRELVLGVTTLLLMVIVGALVHHRRFRFRLSNDAVEVRQGLLRREELRVRFARVQNVQLDQPLWLRPFDLVRFSLETPGAAQAEVELPGIRRALAEHMRDRVIAVRAATGAAPEAQESPAPTGSRDLFEARPARLFRHGMASNQLWLLTALLFSALDLALRRFRDTPIVETALAWLGAQAEGSPVAPLLLALASMTILLGLSGLLAVIRYHGYRLTDADDRLISHAGLLEVQERTLRRDRITGLTLRQSPIGRLLGAWELIARQTRGSDMDAAGVGFDFLVPGLAREDLAISARLLDGATLPHSMQPVSGAFRELFWLRAFLLLLLVLIAQWAAVGFGDPRAVVVALLLPLLLAVFHLRWRRWAWQLDHDRLWVRRGLLGQRIDVFPAGLIQRVSVDRSPFQRRRGLADLRLTLPQGTLIIPFLPQAVAADLANRALYAAETATVHAT